ncbi:RagB/SusD family nutrient uptake outer membrane protein [Salmonirosea aquatica]|uniref:RagB/SusD family nutrient uptake outer membrane protein n=1 Tax=Salmonirosea aquatica TaxID=2654236 RepID=A0A7C9BF12_9BACT|nr:RagB/SusD family nutrient uptake outer membrane protein [Cytophagaceae bacterium SJW1-29]
MNYLLKSKKILGVALLATLLSCKDNLLDPVPNDRISTAIFWKTETDAILAANAAYVYLPGHSTFTINNVTKLYSIFAFDGVTDIGHTNQVFNVNSFIESGSYDASNSRVTDEWENAYTGIATVNDFLENVDRVTTTNTTLIERLKGEMRFLRAYHYVNLASLYGGVPIVTKTLSTDEAKQLKRDDIQKVWDFATSELTAAAAALPTTYPAADKGRITKGAALALLARANLYAGRFQQAATAASEVMKLGYDLYPNYGKLFTYGAENNIEVILDHQYVNSSGLSNNVFAQMAPYSQKTANNTFVPTKALADAFTMKNGLPITDPASGFDPRAPYKDRDPRLGFTMFLSGDPLPSGATFRPEPNSGTTDAVGNTYLATTTGFVVKKYINSEDFGTPGVSGINIILIRYAEVLLTYAEAKIELNQLDQSVYDAINKVRNGRQDVKLPSIATGLSQAELREIVRHEREVELAFEGLRLFDIRRWKIAEKVMPGSIYGMTWINEGTLSTIQVQAFERVFKPTRDYLWPIPQKELDLNPGLTQNPGW